MFLNCVTFQCYCSSPASTVSGVCLLFRFIFCLFELRFLLGGRLLKFWFFQSVFYFLHHLASVCVVPIHRIIPRPGAHLGSSAPHQPSASSSPQRFLSLSVLETLGSWLTSELALLVVTSLDTLTIPSLLSLLSFSAFLRLTLLHIVFFYKQQIIPHLWCNIYITQ